MLLHPTDGGYRSEPGRERYHKEHIPGAGFYQLGEDWSNTQSGYNNTLPSVDTLAQAIGADGIGNDNPVVLYSSSHLMWATRAWWLLRYAGHTNVKVLNGNIGAWIASGEATQSGQNRYPATSFIPSPEPDLFVDTKQVVDGMADSVCTINALSPALYEGTGDFFYGRRGHIPGSRSVYFADILRDEFFLPADELRGAGGAANVECAANTYLLWWGYRGDLRWVCLHVAWAVKCRCIRWLYVRVGCGSILTLKHG